MTKEANQEANRRFLGSCGVLAYFHFKNNLHQKQQWKNFKKRSLLTRVPIIESLDTTEILKHPKKQRPEQPSYLVIDVKKGKKKKNIITRKNSDKTKPRFSSVDVEINSPSEICAGPRGKSSLPVLRKASRASSRMGLDHLCSLLLQGPSRHQNFEETAQFRNHCNKHFFKRWKVSRSHQNRLSPAGADPFPFENQVQVARPEPVP